MTELVLTVFFAIVLVLILKKIERRKQEKITQYKFSGPNAHIEAKKFLASIDPSQIA